MSTGDNIVIALAQVRGFKGKPCPKEHQKRRPSIVSSFFSSKVACGSCLEFQLSASSATCTQHTAANPYSQPVQHDWVSFSPQHDHPLVSHNQVITYLDANINSPNPPRHGRFVSMGRRARLIGDSRGRYWVTQTPPTPATQPPLPVPHLNSKTRIECRWPRWLGSSSSRG